MRSTPLAARVALHPGCPGDRRRGRAAAFVVDGNAVTPLDTGTNGLGAAITSAPTRPPSRSRPTARPPSSRTAANVTPVDVATNAAAPRSVGDNPQAIAITPDGKTATSSRDPHVTPITVASNDPGTDIPSARARGIAITPDGKTAYVEPDASVTPIDVATSARRGDRRRRRRRGHRRHPRRQDAYVATPRERDADDGRVERARRRIPVGDGPQAIAITPDGKTAYVANTARATSPRRTSPRRRRSRSPSARPDRRSR